MNKNIILLTAMLMAWMMGSPAWATDGPKEEIMRSNIVFQSVEEKDDGWIDRNRLQVSCSENCKRTIESLNGFCDGGPSTGYVEEKDPACALMYGVLCFPLNVMWKSITFPWQASMDCCERNRALYSLCGKKEGDEVREKRLTMRYEEKRIHVQHARSPVKSPTNLHERKDDELKSPFLQMEEIELSEYKRERDQDDKNY